MRLIDADELLRMMVKAKDFGELSARSAIRRVKEAPTVDAELVIRCRDCKYLRLTGKVWRCQNRLVMMLCEPDDYCSRAVRNAE